MADQLLESIARYIIEPPQFSKGSYETALYCLLDSLGCAALATRYPACTKLLGPIIPDIQVPNGFKVPFTNYVLDPVSAAFNLGTMIRWLDFNDTWLSAEWGHPSDNIGGLLPVCDYKSRQNKVLKEPSLTVNDLLAAMIKAYEIQGVIALENSFNQIGFDHVILVKAATAAVTTHLLGGSYENIVDALSQSWIDTGPLRTYRHAPNVGSRKSWAAGDATSRGVWLALLTMRGEKGYATPLSAKRWGLYDALFQGHEFKISKPFGCYVMENILFKCSFPAEFHAQTAVEAAIILHPVVKERLKDIDKIVISTHASAIKIIDKIGPLHNPADRDHCLQYMVAIGLLQGFLRADDYEDKRALDPLIDTLRQKMEVIEDPSFSLDYHDPAKRSVSNAIKIYFKNGDTSENVCIQYPAGHQKRRKEGFPLLLKKLEDNLRPCYSEGKFEKLIESLSHPGILKNLEIHSFLSLFSI